MSIFKEVPVTVIFLFSEAREPHRGECGDEGVLRVHILQHETAQYQGET